MREDDRNSIISEAKRLMVSANPDRDSSVRFVPGYKETWSNSLGVGRRQRGRFVKYLKSKGLGYTPVDSMGRPRFLSDRHRRKVARAMNHVNMESYYD